MAKCIICGHGGFNISMAENKATCQACGSVYNLDEFRDQYTDFDIANGVLKHYNGSNRIVYIPDNVHEIGEAAFADNSGIEEVILPDGITYIGEQAFINCIALRRVDMNDEVIKIGKDAFRGCILLNDIKMPRDLIVVSAGAFWNCAALTEIILPQGVTTIGIDAFSHCRCLKRLYLPNSISRYPRDKGLASFCPVLRDVKCPDTMYNNITQLFFKTPWIQIAKDEDAKRRREMIAEGICPDCGVALVKYSWGSEYMCPKCEQARWNRNRDALS